jgi:hypothetical protein
MIFLIIQCLEFGLQLIFSNNPLGSCPVDVGHVTRMIGDSNPRPLDICPLGQMSSGHQLCIPHNIKRGIEFFIKGNLIFNKSSICWHKIEQYFKFF